MGRRAFPAGLGAGLLALASLGAQCTPGSIPTGNCRAGRTCQVGRCTVHVPDGAIPANRAVTLAELPVPTELDGETVAPFGCGLDVPNGTATIPLRLTLRDVPTPPLGSVLFRYEPPRAVMVASSVPSAGRIEALVTQTGAYGATVAPRDWAVETTLTNDPLTSGTTAELVRNLSLQSINAAYFDGARLFVGNGPRVLVYDGVPAGPQVKPKLVLGQPGLDEIVPGTSSSKTSGNVGAIWSDGTRLVVATGNRILIWNTMPTADFATADLVLGQQDFVSANANIGGISAATLSAPQQIDCDGTHLLVADTMNHRVLAWTTFPTAIGQPADAVLGQPSFAAGDPGTFYQAWGAALHGTGAFVASAFSGSYHYASVSASNPLPTYRPIDPSFPDRVQKHVLTHPTSVTKLAGGGLAMSDLSGARIAIHRRVPEVETPLDFVLGQPDPMRRVTQAANGSTVSSSAKVIAAHGLTLIPDKTRLLVYEDTPAFTFAPASRVVGQASFTVTEVGTDYRRLSGRTLAHPADVAVHGDTIAIADRSNNRVVLHRKTGLPSSNAEAGVVLGQPDMTSFVPNVDQVTPGARTLSGPSGVALATQHLVVADTENHRILVWSPVPTVSNTPATFVLGQSSFEGRRPNHGRGDANADGYSDAAADGVFYPTGVATDGTRLFVADRMNHRVLVWNDLASLANDKPADRVIGQPDFSSVRANRATDDRGGHFASPDGLNLPTGLTLVGTSLWIADSENNRVVRYDSVATAPRPSLFLGQPNGGAITNPNVTPIDEPSGGYELHPPTTAGSVLRPRAVAVSANAVYVSELDSHRVHVFARNGDVVTPHGQLGQPTGESAVLNANGIGPRSLAGPQGLALDDNQLFVVDAGNHRVLRFDATAPPKGPDPATAVVGQTSFAANGFDQSAAPTAGGGTRPRGMAILGNELYVAETNLHRIVVHELPLVPGKTPKRVIGQPDVTISLPNAGGAPSASSLASPRGLAVDDTHLVVADTANHRVLLFPRDGSTAAIVLGQSSFTDSRPNRGGPPGASSLLAPEGAAIAGGHLVVADAGNHRVLVWNSVPTTNGQPADLVIGQADFASSATNRGTGNATAATLALPTAVHITGERLFIADSGNNRVLVFDPLPTTSGASATAALGQPDLVSRTATADIMEKARLAGPVALASDGANLYVADRDASRVVAFDLHGLASGAPAAFLFNANGGLTATNPGGLAVERTPFFTSRLFVADTNADRLLVLGSVRRLR